jgi:hypothetical protein
VQELRYSRAASVVRGCAYTLQPGVIAGQLPFVGDATARQIDDILTTGSCQSLDLFRYAAAQGCQAWGLGLPENGYAYVC